MELWFEGNGMLAVDNCIELERYMPLIVKQACICNRKYNNHQIYELEDLINEGILVFYKINDFYDVDIYEFSGLLKKSLMNRFSSILKDIWKCAKTVRLDSVPERTVDSDPAKMLEVISLLQEGLKKKDFQYLFFLLTPPEELKIIVNKEIEKRLLWKIKRMLEN